MLALTAKNYKQDFRQSLLSSNKVDTVNMHPISNVAVDAEIIYSESISTVNYKGQQYTLPIDTTVESTYFRSNRNIRNPGEGILEGAEYAKARMDCVMVSGTTVCKTSKAIQGSPSVNIRLVGTSSTLNRGGSTYDSYPAYTSLFNRDFALAHWIENNKVDTKNYFTLDYSGASFSLNTWVRNVVPIDSGEIPVANDILTEWVDASDLTANAITYADWVETTNVNTNGLSKFKMYSPSDVPPSNASTLTYLYLYNISLPINKGIRKLDDYTYEVTWTVPVRISYAAASRRPGGLFEGPVDIDNFAFSDRVSEIVIEISGVPYNTDTKDISYSLDRDGNLTSVLSNKYPLEIDAGEAFTSQTYVDSEPVVTPVTLDVQKNVGYYDYVTGELKQEQTNSRQFAWVDVVAGESYYLSTWKGSALIACIIYYNSAGAVVGYDQLGTGTLTQVIDYLFTVPSGATRMVIQSERNYDTFSLSKYAKPLWTERLATIALHKYREGKYTVNCIVSATYALKNSVKIGTQMQVKLPDNTFITRNNIPCTFEVKNITKRYSNREITFELSLLEV